MVANQIYQIVQSTVSQALGETTVVETEADFVSAGKKVLSSDTSTEKWFGVLLDRVARTVIDMRAYMAVDNGLWREPFEFGAILQMLYVDMPKATEEHSWSDKTRNTDAWAPASDLKVSQSLYSDIAVWEYDITLPDIQLRPAFASSQAMAAFLEGMMLAMSNSLEVSIESVNRLCRATFAARKIHANNGVINVLHEYNTATNAGLTVDTALRNPDFWRFFANLVMLIKRRMMVMSTAYNVDKLARFTPADELRIDMLSNAASALNVYLQSSVYHDAMTDIGAYNDIPFWQGSGLAYDFDDVSKIIIKTADIGETAVTQSGIVGMIYDPRAMGVTIDNRRTRAIYNPKKEFTNYFAKVDRGYYNNMSHNGVILTMVES